MKQLQYYLVGILLLLHIIVNAQSIQQISATPSQGGGYGQTATYKHECVVGGVSSSIITNTPYNGSSIGFLYTSQNLPPTANAGADQIVVENSTVTLTGAASSDPEGSPLSYSWTSLDGVTLSSSAVVNPTFTAPAQLAQRKYRFKLQVSDGLNNSNADTVVITIRDVNWQPVVYTTSCALIALPTFSGVYADIPDVVGAFSSTGECRGVQEVVIISSIPYAIFNVQLAAVELISFKIHDFSANQVCDVPGTFSMSPQGSSGTPQNPLLINAQCNSINVGTIASTLCAGQSISVPFSFSGIFTSGNIFTAQLSNASGSFASPITIGTLNSTSGTTIPSQIPANTTVGTGYRIRVVGANPAIIGTDNGTNISINTAGFSPVIASSISDICVGGTGTLSITNVGTTGTITRQWQISTDSVTFSNISAATGTTYTIPTALTANSYFYRLQITKSGVACPAFSNSRKVNVRPDPTVSITGGGASFCGTGGGVLLSSICSPPLGTATYTWQRGTNGTTFGNIAGANGSSYTTPTVSTTTYYRLVYGNSGVGCTAGTSNSQAITINTLPNVTVNPTTYSMCVGGTKTLTASGATTYSWSPSTNLNTTTGATVSANPSATTVYTVTGTNTTTGCAKSVSTTLTVVPIQIVSITASASAICTGGSVSLTAATTGGAGTCVFIWQQSTNGVSWATISGASANTYTSPVLTATMYYRVLRSCNGGGCGAVYSNVKQIVVSPLPTLTLSGANTVCTGGTPVLTATLVGGAGACPFVWEKSIDNGMTWTPITGIISANYTSAALTQNTSFRVSSTCNGLACGGAISNVLSITVVPDPAITITGNTDFCGSSSTVLTANVSGGIGTCTMQWQEYTTAWVNLLGATASTYTTPVLSAAKSYRVVQTCTGTGCNTAYSALATIIIKPLPNVTVSPSTYDMCVGGSKNLVASGANSYSWTPSTGLNTSTGATVIATPSTTTTYYVTGTSTSNGCSKTVSATINVAADPIASIVGNSTVCINGAASLTASIAGGTGTYSYLWQSSTNGTTWTTISGATAASYLTPTLNVNTYYKVKVTSSNTSCDPNFSAPFLVSVVPQPTISLAGNNVICVGGTTSLTATISGGTGTCPLIWENSLDNINWATINGATATNYTTPILNTPTYYRVSTNCNGAGCQMAISSPFLVTVMPNTSVTVNGGGSYCGPQAVTLTAVQTGGAGTCTYQWQEYISNVWVNISGATNSNFTSPVISSNKYYRNYTACAGSGCTVAYSPIVTVVIKALPTVSISPSLTDLCTGGTKTLAATGGNTYSWFPSTGLNTTTNYAVIASPTATTTYYVTGTNTSTGCSNTASATVTISPDPIASVTGANTLCLNGSTVLNSNITGGAGTYTYIWQSSANATTWANISGATSSNYAITGFTSNTYYRVKVTSSITSCDPNFSSGFLVSLVSQPSTTLAGGGTFAANASVTLSSTVTGGVSLCSRKWQSSSSGNAGTWTNLTGITTSTYTFNAANTSYYRVIYNCASSCDSAISNTVLVTVTPPSRIAESFSSDISLYPNPASSEVTLSCPAMPNGKIVVKLVDAIGRETGVWEYDLEEKGHWEKQYNLTNYASGVYMFHVFSDGKEQTIKFVKE